MIMVQKVVFKMISDMFGMTFGKSDLKIKLLLKEILI